jgi:hypothetical protein
LLGRRLLLAGATHGHLGRKLTRSLRKTRTRWRIPAWRRPIWHVWIATRSWWERRRGEALSIGRVEALLELWLLRVARRRLLSTLRLLRGEARSTRSGFRTLSRNGSWYILLAFKSAR